MPRPQLLFGFLFALAALPALGQEEPAPAGTDANKAVVRRYLEVLSGGDLGQLDEILSPDFADRTPGAPAGLRGPAAIREDQRRARELFQDVRYTLADLVAEGDRVAARYTVQARHRGSGKAVEVTGVTLFRMAGGKIQEAWIVNDLIEMFRQLGYTLQPPQTSPPPAAPPPPQPPSR